MVKKKAIKILFIISLLQLVASCKEKGTEHPQTKPFKNPREMTWTADTLKTTDPHQLQILPKNLLVFTSNDAWLCCWADGPLGQMWRYDGKDWTINDIGKDVIGKPADIVGLASNNLLTGGYIGDNVFIARYIGSNWTDVYPGFYTVDPSKWLKGDILDMSTDRSGNIWACGRNGLVMKYENNKWTTDTIDLNLNDDVAYWLKSIESYNGRTFILASTANKTTSLEKYYYLAGEMNNFVVLDSMVFNSPSVIIKWGYLQLYSSNFSKLYSSGLSGVWMYQDKDWEKILDVNGTIYNIYGKAENYLLAVGDYNNVLFYNGSTWMSIADLFKVDDRTFIFKNVWTDGNEIIITGYGTVKNKQGTIIWHGK